MSAGNLGLSSLATMSDGTLRNKVRSLEAVNDTVLSVYDQAFFLHRVIMNPQGTELRRFVASIAALLIDSETGTVAKYRAIFANGSLAEQKRTVGEEQLQTIERTMRRLTSDSSNDNLSRTQMLTIFFSALVIENAIFSVLLPSADQAIRQFAPDDSLVPVSAESNPTDQTCIASTVFLTRRALTAFATKYLQLEFSRLVDGANEVLESSETFAENCVNAYISQLPAYMPIELAQKPPTTAATTSRTK
jgi:hypothetical protein